MPIITPLTDAEIDELLQATSRTFALTIPLLPDVERREVGLAYLVFRIADTFEDAENYDRDERVRALLMFLECLTHQDRHCWLALADRCRAHPPSSVVAYNELLFAMPRVFESLAQCEDESVRIVVFDASRSARGMIETLQRADELGYFELTTCEELQRYCYHVAGIVGEMLTRLFSRRLMPGAIDELLPLARDFGEGLQLVNILKDAEADATVGRRYFPSVDRKGVMSLAHWNLHRARLYLSRLERCRAPLGYLQFSQLPIELAEATLRRMMKHGAGAKIERYEVAEILARVAVPVNALVDSDQ